MKMIEYDRVRGNRKDRERAIKSRKMEGNRRIEV